jgi:hypothetical protein
MVIATIFITKSFSKMLMAFTPEKGKYYYFVLDGEIYQGKYTGTHGTKYFLFTDVLFDLNAPHHKKFTRGVFVAAGQMFQFHDNAELYQQLNTR